MSERASIPASQRYRARAEESRIQAESYRDPKARTQMLQLAADYDRKAVQAEAFAIADGDSLPRHA
ncbi:MAG: hypothetical protein WCF66_13845 [Pseudolabrys sp.]